MKAIDSSTIIKFGSKEDGWEGLQMYIAEGITLGFAINEFGNAMWKKVKRDEVRLEEALSIFAKCKTVLPLADESKYANTALELAVKYNMAFYDALFVAFAIVENLDFVTSDEKQARVAEKLGVKVVLC